MADNPFSDREIGDVAIGEIDIFPSEVLGLGNAMIAIDMVNKDGGQGPQVRIATGFDTNDQMTLKEFQLAALERALLLLRRISDETPESLREIWIRTCNEAKNEPPSVSIGEVTITQKVR
jgi:hypothetical protein